MDKNSSEFFDKKIVSRSQLREIVGAFPRQKKIIICHGTFDIVHPGHIRHLLYAKSKADILVASLTCDKHVTKCDMRPYIPEHLRAVNLAALQMVDYVIIDDEATPLKTIATVQPDFFAKGYEYVSGGIPPKTQDEMDALEQYGGEMIFSPGDVVYSSSKFIEGNPPNLCNEKLLLLMKEESFTLEDLRTALTRFKGARVHVIGDTIIDSFTYCSMIGGMTKTPTMSLRFEDKRDFVGGAGIVAKHLRAAGAQVTFSTLLGDDAFGAFARDDLALSGVDVLAVTDPTRPTTNKNAIIANDYRLLKVDTLDNRTISEKVLRQFVKQIEETPADIVVFSDFRHGIFNKQTIAALIQAIPEHVFRVADSQVASRWGNITDFPNFDLITPNEKEARFALGDQDSVVRPLGAELFQKAKCKTLILKLGKRGIMTFRDRPGDDPRNFIAIDSFAKQVVDAVGAGDALLAYAALALATDPRQQALASVLGSIAAGLACESDGNQPVSPESIRQRLLEIEREIHFDKALAEA